MKKFIYLVLSENGMPSSKRTITFLLLLAFLAVVFINVFTTKQPIAELREELFYAFSGSLATIFGSNALDAWKDVKKTQSANNATVGAPSPTPSPDTTTIIK